ncbi:50S ribosomal protein L24 [Candidatus Chloroploca sp. M-50]|uniref:Large ribosomal subunit protein uL24 n=2 Tax=Candidatus Chloroploca TaxID=1579476 RepID=A0A2H3LAZ3_9CHLR|nr:MULTISPECIES: 50S ribosomal protein L24 [Candidatus Chloroploca]MBP1467616.1 50S ribosomal protein L24 [Candidatus Chloroploca mongolica]PDW00683.1 50S ribosomal protein L24 [Candidatus Chloroploca asiatica]
MHVKTGDEVLIITGKDKGRSGKIKRMFPSEGRVVVEGLNIVKRHTKARGPGKPAGIIDIEASLDMSNVMLICPSCKRASRTGYRFLEETDHKGRPRKVRFCKACDATID